ncbi:MAG: recombinase family protein [Lachnospiraceae bacterium]|nr:recombinase family protein [Lachnospiraceae bacterium]
MKNVCGYIRVSTDQQTELSPDAQIRLLQEYCDKKGYFLNHIYKDLGISGRNAKKRPAFQEMIADCKSKDHPYDAILVWKFSRFARNQEESIVFKSMLRKVNVDVYSVSEDLPDGEFSGLIERIIEWMDEYYSIRLSGEVMRGMSQNAMNGGYNAIPPFGYTKAKGEIPVIQEENAEIVQMCYEMFLSGSSYASIARKINDMGIRTKRGRKWENRNIKYMIRNPFYIGKIRWNYYDRQHNQEKPREEWIITDGQHQPIISQENFDAAQKIADAQELRCKPKRPKTSAAGSYHWLCGMVKCDVCGGTLSHVSSGNSKTGQRWHYLKCWQADKGKCPNHKSLRLDKAEQMVLDYLYDMFVLKKNVDYHIVHIDRNPVDHNDIIQSELSKLNDREKRIKAAYIDGIDSLEEYKYNKRTLQKQREELQKQLTTPNQPSDKKAPHFAVDDGIALFDGFQDLDTEHKTEIIRSFFDHIIYHYDTDTMEFYLHG